MFINLCFISLLVSSSWTSRGQRCSTIPPTVSAFIFIAQRVQCSSTIHRTLLTHNLALFAGQVFTQERVYEQEHTLGETRTHNLTRILTRSTNYSIGGAIVPFLVVPHRAPLPQLLCRGRPRACVICFIYAATAAGLLLLLLLLLLLCCCYV